MKAWLADLPTTSLVAVTGCVLACGTAAFYFGAVMTSHAIDSVNFGLWLGFCAALMGVSYRWFGKKRDTYQPSPPAPPDIEDAPAAESKSEPPNLIREKPDGSIRREVP